MRRLVLLTPLCLLAACVQTQAPAPAPEPAPDGCHAAQFGGLVGQPRAVLDKMRLPPATRVIGPHQAVTADFRPDRLNFEIAETGLIAKIGCY